MSDGAAKLQSELTPERWQKLRDMVLEVLELDPAQRASFLNQACGSDDAMRSQAESLICADDEVRSTFLNSAPTLRGPALLEGTRIGDYEIVSLIGAGGMGEVYRARDTKLGRDVAIKLLPAYFSTDPDRLRRFEQEARAAAALNHPNVLSVHQLGSYEGKPYLVSELLEGQTLREVLKRARLSIRRAIELAIQMARGLSAAHEKGIAHRDLKPENLFVTKDGRVKILDFGLAKLLPLTPQEDAAATQEHKTGAGVVMGTVGYMSPEQVRGQRTDNRTDIFSFGVILYEMLAGDRPFKGETSADTLSSILNKEPEPIAAAAPTVPPGLQRIVQRCLEKDPEQRFQSASDLAFALDALSDTSINGFANKRIKVNAAGLLGPKVILAFAVTATLVLVIQFFHWPRSSGWIPDVQRMTPVKLTHSRNIDGAAISPDGRYLAYTVPVGADYVLWIRQLVEDNPIKIATLSNHQMASPIFSADGNYVFVHVEDGSVYVVPAMGGLPRKLLTDALSNVSPSPNGRRLAYVSGSGLDAVGLDRRLVICNPDGTEKQAIATAKPAGDAWFDSRSSPGWSPDGNYIAVAGQRRDGEALFVYPVIGGKPLVYPFEGAAGAVWLPDQKGIIVQAAPEWLALRGIYQLWFQPFPAGSPKRLTSDLSGYGSLTLTADGHTLATVKVDWQTRVYLGPSSNPDAAFEVQELGSDNVGLQWVSNQRLLLSNLSSQISLTNVDGTQNIRVLAESGGDNVPGTIAVCRGHDRILFEKGSYFRKSVWQSALDGTDLHQLTPGRGEVFPDCSVDGSSIIYSVMTSNGTRPVRSSLSGGPIIPIEGFNVGIGRFSPDGKKIALLTQQRESDSPKIEVLSSDGSTRLQEFGISDTPANMYRLSWTADGKAITYFVEKGKVINVWEQPLSGGAPKQITHASDSVLDYDWSPDGKQIATIRGSMSRDVVLLRFH